MELNRLSNGMLVDEDGEILEEVTLYKKSNQIVKTFEPSNIKRNTKFFKLRDSRDARRAMNKLTLEESGLLTKLLQYIEWDTNRVLGDGDIVGEKDKPLKMYEIDKLCGIAKSTRVRIIDSLLDKKVIAYDPETITNRTKTIIINPLYGYKGAKPPIVPDDLFDEAVR